MKCLKPTTGVSKGSYFLIVCAMLLFLVTLPMGIQAQDTAGDTEAAAPATAPAVQQGETRLIDVILMGGIWMIPLAALSLACVGLIVNNFMMLQKKKLTREDLLPGLLQQLAQRDIDGALQTCAANPCLFTNILEGGLARITTDEILPANIQQGIDQTGQAQISNLIKPVNYLSNIGAVSPMVGLLGTVSGMIKAFQGLSLGAGSNAEAMAANISEALVTTASGLIIAIPAMLFYFFFKNNFMETLSFINAEIGRLLNALETGAVTYIPSDHMNDEEDFEE
ncbi:MAG: MotA/TolQ/ExbB proton channel family protein [Verrucomicrobia bacterium]|nr:MotA/TolQ/ExbB proton channel family protein [Verrucomicrobiota bacterium]MCH8513763.1 MotA/TolQ/ExbB proton channel family protein [Kiritimatiellia bacterium]